MKDLISFKATWAKAARKDVHRSNPGEATAFAGCHPSRSKDLCWLRWGGEGVARQLGSSDLRPQDCRQRSLDGYPSLGSHMIAAVQISGTRLDSASIH